MHTHGGHLIFIAVPAWGHLRPLTDLATKIVGIQAGSPSERRNIITFLTVGDFNDRVKKEIALTFDGQSPELKTAANKYIRVISMGGEGSDFLGLRTQLAAEFSVYYDLLLAERPVSCRHTGRVYEALPKPKTAVIDMLGHSVAQIIYASKTPIPVVTSAPTAASLIFRTMAPSSLGGLGELQSRIEEVSAEGRDEAKIKAMIVEAWIPNTGNIIRIPGMHDMYDYEASPQEPSPYATQGEVLSGVFQHLSQSAGMLLHSTPAYEPETIPALRSLLEKWGTKLFPIGPLVPPTSTPKREPHEKGLYAAGKQDRVTDFLDAALERHGKNSVLYISFGSVFWPPKPEYVWAWLEELLDLGIPFICSTASPMCDIPEALRSQIAKSGLGLLTPWAPQPTILAHLATGWFMSHCGYNSVMEAMSAGVPVIAWPIEADQPFSATYISLCLDAGFELIQVRTGVRGLRPLHRGKNSDSFVQPQGTLEAVRDEARDILRRARGEEGQLKRQNAETLRTNLQAVWEAGGDSRNNVEEFLVQFAAA